MTLTVLNNQSVPDNLGSKQLVQFRCDCGKITEKIWKNYATGHTTSCGQCNLLTADHFKTAKYGKLRMKDPQVVSRGSHKKVVWICDCGREVSIAICYVIADKRTSCGQCNLLTADHFKTAKYGKLRMKDPQVVSRGSHKKVVWICDCGREVSATTSHVLSGNTTSCGQCNLLTANHFKTAKYGKLRMKDPQDTYPRSEKVVVWICDCGREAIKKICYVIGGETTSCGLCNAIPAVSTAKFGRLRMKVPTEIRRGSHIKMAWICDCGNEVMAQVHNVTRGLTVSCGKCYENAVAWYTANRKQLLTLSVPINPSQIPGGFLVAIDTIIRTGTPFPAICGLCGSHYSPLWDNVRLGKSLTCGCSTHRVSIGQMALTKFIESITDAHSEFKLGKFSYDVCVENARLLIEYNGLKWHSGNMARHRDARKYAAAIQAGYRLLTIYEDEWQTKPKVIQQLITNILGASNATKLRPNACCIHQVSKVDADVFYDQFHYIGACRPKISYGAFLKEQLIACMSFSHPTRQSKHSWELVRMASDPKYRIHGIWSKLLKEFVQAHTPPSIVSFSDNRLFGGRTYEKIGFRFDGDVPPDYYWVVGSKRRHKSAMRKSKTEKASGLTESQLREAQGYQKIWDLGKKRWVWS